MITYKRPIVIYNNPNDNRENSVIRYIGERVLNNNKNFLCALTGGTGEGKSWGALSIAEIYSKMFNIEFKPENHIIHSLKQALELITMKNVEQKVRYGSLLVFEELQVEGNTRNWYTEGNKALNRVISTFRDQRLIVLFTTPVLNFIDKHSRLLFHGEFEVLGFNRITKITTIKPRFLYPKKNAFSNDEFYRKCLLVKYKVEGKERYDGYKLTEWEIPKASDDILIPYERIKKAFNEKLNIDELKELAYRERIKQSRDKSEDFMKIKELLDKYGENYFEICKVIPHLAPYTIERMVGMIKKSLKATAQQQVIA
jgi:hypothetical protein